MDTKQLHKDLQQFLSQRFAFKVIPPSEVAPRWLDILIHHEPRNYDSHLNFENPVTIALMRDMKHAISEHVVALGFELLDVSMSTYSFHIVLRGSPKGLEEYVTIIVFTTRLPTALTLRIQ